MESCNTDVIRPEDDRMGIYNSVFEPIGLA